MISGGEAVAKVLKGEGVKYLFTLCVRDYAPLYLECIKEGIDVISTRHEQAAAYAADAWGRITRDPGVCLAIGGCGNTNMATALIGAYYECSPMIGLFPQGEGGKALSGKGESRLFSPAALRPYVKWAGHCDNASQLAEHVRMAFRHATSGRKGPALLEMPTEALLAKCPEPEPIAPGKYRIVSCSYGDLTSAEKAVKLLLNANRPLILSGNGVYWSGAFKELEELATLLNIPVVSKAGLAQGSFPEEHPLFSGVLILARPALPQKIVPRADVILAIGIKFEELSAIPEISPDAKIIQVDIEPSEIGRNVRVDLGIVGDAKTVLSHFVKTAKEMLPANDRAAWLKYLQETKASYEADIALSGSSSTKPVRPARLVREIAGMLSSNWYVIIDGADIASMARTYLRARFPGQFMVAHGDFGNMGPGIPFALGTKLARPDKHVLLITSDGAFGFNAMELETALRYNIPFICVISNNLCWGAEYHPLRVAYNEEIAVKLGSTMSEKVRYDKLAEAMGCYGERITDPEEVRPALKRALDSGLPAVLDVRVDTEDMWPTRSAAWTASLK